jgi:exopolyphosphatase/guanosine-5'-triphosphate,3'-diphosphate pyrophosphatase
MAGLLPSEARYVRKLASLLRVADALDRSHAQPIRQLRAVVGGNKVVLRLSLQGPADLELWDVEREATLFRQVFGAELAVSAGPARPQPRPTRKTHQNVT